MICSNWCIVESLQPRIQAWVSVYEFISANIISGLRFAHEKARVWPNSITLLFGDGINYSYYYYDYNFYFLFLFFSYAIHYRHSRVYDWVYQRKRKVTYPPISRHMWVGRTRDFPPKLDGLLQNHTLPQPAFVDLFCISFWSQIAILGATSLRFRLAIPKSFCFPLQANLLKKVQLVTWKIAGGIARKVQLLWESLREKPQFLWRCPEFYWVFLVPTMRILITGLLRAHVNIRTCHGCNIQW